MCANMNTGNFILSKKFKTIIKSINNVYIYNDKWYRIYKRAYDKNVFEVINVMSKNKMPKIVI
jgi:hypothetical protein